MPSPVHFVAPAGWYLIYSRPNFDDRDSLDLRAVGDISLARNVEHGLRPRPSGWLMEPVADLLAGEIVVGNLESPFARARRPENVRPGPYRLPADPAFVDRLAPFTALSLANNHALDAGPPGLLDSWRTLHDAGIGALGLNSACGSGSSVTMHALDLHLLAYNVAHDPQDRPDEAARCGRAWLDERALDEIESLRHASDRPIVVLVHWGDEYAAQPNAEQQRWAGRLVEAGASLILGAHPHVLQPAEIVRSAGRTGFVAYSLGNFVFDQPDKPETNGGIVLRAWLDDQGVGAVAVAPVAMTGGRPVPLDPHLPQARAYVAAIASAPVAGGVQSSRRPVPTSAAQSEPQAWRWNGETFVPLHVPEDVPRPAPSTSLVVDLHGDGEPLQASLGDGRVELRDGDEIVWRNEESSWHVDGMTQGDVDNDGRYELLVWLWKPDQRGVPRSHPFLVGWRGGRYRVFWGGSAVADPIQHAAIGAVTGARNVLVVLEGGVSPDEPATHVAVWTWQGWNFERFWQSESGTYTYVDLRDLDGDGVADIVAW